MEYRLETLSEKKLVGKRMIMTFADNRTTELWKSFMPQRKEITNSIGVVLYSIQMYKPLFFNNFNPNTEFEKWAATEVADFKVIPDGMETLIMVGGLYAVFIYKGASGAAGNWFRYIFETWLPKSDYVLDDRPHFEILGNAFKMGSEDSEEEVWVPVKYKNKVSLQ